METTPHKIPIVFYRTSAWAEVVLDWLRGLDEADRNTIGQDLMRVQFRWPVGMPLCRPLGDGLWEIRSSLTSNRIARVLFCFTEGRLLPLHGFIKKTQKTPDDELKLARKRKREFIWEGNTMATNEPRSVEGLTTLDSFLDQQGTREAFQTVAVKEVLAWQLRQAMETEHLSQKKLAEKMGTSRSQISRLLDPTDGNVTLVTVQRAAALLGKKVRLELI
jgi:phage-related protein/predicted XRE-type DNA-binding protein